MDGDFFRDAGVIKSETLAECTNFPAVPVGIKGPFVGKIPVVIAEPVVQIVVEADIKFKEPILEIKRIKKNLFIDQCKVIDLGFGGKAKLFLGGYVRKNIEYATADKILKGNGILGDIRHATFNIPFNCVTEIDYVVPVQQHSQEPDKRFSLNIECKKGKNCCEDIIVGNSPCEDNFQHFEKFNEPVFCELEEVKFFESDIHGDSKPLTFDSKSEFVFGAIKEKIIILVRLKLLQKQQVSIPGKG